MQLRIAEPTRIIVDREVTYVQAEDPSGRFGILPGHERYLTALAPSILIYRYLQNGSEHESYVAVRSGVLRVTPDGVHVAVQEAHADDDLAGLQKRIRNARENTGGRSYRATRSLYQMQISAWRSLMEFGNART